jgi:DNA transposition AAA+ family ATPase
MATRKRIKQCARYIIFENEGNGKKITQQEAERLAKERLEEIRKEEKNLY